MTGSYDSPLGRLRIEITEDAITGICLMESVDETAGSCPLMELCKKELAEYFAGERKVFSFPILPRGTDFQQKIWKELRKIPYGQALSYGEVALRACGSSRYARAAAAAAHRNPILLVIPCHRMIGKDGSLVGFAAGLSAKEYLLELERSHIL